MAAAYVRDTGRQRGENVASLALNFGTLPAAGNSIITCVSCWDGASANVPAVTDNQPPTTTHARDVQSAASGGATASIHSRHNISSPSGTFTVTVNPDGADDYIEAVAAEFSGLATSSTVDQTQAATGSSATPTVTSGTTTQADELVVGCMQVSVGDDSVGIDALGAPWSTLALNQDALVTIGHYSAYKIVSSTGTQNFSGGTLDSSANWGAVVATYKAASGGGGGGISGALSQTLGDATASAAGTLALSGSLSQTLAAATLASTGALSITGALSATLGEATLSAEGSLQGDGSGQLSVTLDAATVSGVGALAISGALSSTLADASLSADGKVAIRAALSVQLDGASVQAMGASGALGSVSVTLADATLEATAEVTGEPAPQNKGAGRARSRRRYLVEIDGQTFQVESAEHAEALLDRAKELARKAAEAKAQQIERKQLPRIRNLGKVEPLRITPPAISTDAPINLSAIVQEIGEIYQQVSLELEMRMMLERERQVEEEAVIQLLM